MGLEEGVSESLSVLRYQLFELINTLDRIEGGGNGSNGTYQRGSSNGNDASDIGRDATDVGRVAKQNRGDSEIDGEVNSKWGTGVHQAATVDRGSVEGTDKGDKKGNATGAGIEKGEILSRSGFNVKLDSSVHVRVMGEKLSSGVLSRLNPFRNYGKYIYGKSIYVVRQEGHGLFGRWSGNGNGAGFNARLSKVIRNLENKLSTGYYKVKLLDAKGRSLINEGKITKDKVLAVVKKSIAKGDFSSSIFQKYMFSAYREASIKITQASPPLGARISAWAKDVIVRAAGSVRQWVDNKVANFKNSVGKAASAALKTVAKIHDSYTRKNYLLDNIQSRADAQTLIKAFNAIDKSDVKFGNFDVQRWATHKMFDCPRAVSAALSSLANQKSVDAPRQFADTVYNVTKSHIQSRIKLQIKAEAKEKAQAKTKAESQAKVKAKAKPQVKAQAKSKTKSQTKPQTQFTFNFNKSERIMNGRSG
jgi:hypothetical protein